MTTPDGLLIVDKPAGWTSHDVVARCRRLCGTRITDDAEGEITASHDVAALTAEAVERGVAALTGRIAQVPSAVSAIKVDGQRSYARVRAGQDVVLPARKVTVSRFDILDQRTKRVHGHQVWDLDVSVEVSSGTYIRALARDLGAALGVGGHLTALRRTRVGRFGLDDAQTLAELEMASETDAIPVIELADAARASFAVRELTAAEAIAVGYGQRIASQPGGNDQPVAAFAPEGHLVAMLDESGSLAKAHVVFSPSGS